MALLKFEFNSIHLLFPFLSPIFLCLRYNLITFLQKPNAFLALTFLMFLGELLCGTLELISIYMSTKSSSIDHSIHIKEKYRIGLFEYVQKEKTSKSHIYILLIIVLVAFLDGVSYYSVLVITSFDINYLSFQLRIILLFFTALLSKFILKYNIHRHHVLSIVLIIISAILFTFIEIRRYPFYFALYYALIFLIQSIPMVLEKWLMHYKYISPYRLLFFKGCFGMLFILIFGLILYFSKCGIGWGFCNKDNPIDNILLSLKVFFIEPPINSLKSIGVILTSWGSNLFNILTTYYFTPNHQAVSDSLSSCLLWIIIMIRNGSLDDNIQLTIAAYIITLIACLVYNEILILYCCSLERNTNKEIGLRGNQENNLVNCTVLNIEDEDSYSIDINTISKII